MAQQTNARYGTQKGIVEKKLQRPTWPSLPVRRDCGTNSPKTQKEDANHVLERREGDGKTNPARKAKITDVENKSCATCDAISRVTRERGTIQIGR